MASVAPPVNVEDCLTATRALATGIANDKIQRIVSGMAVIGGVAVAALTRKLVENSEGLGIIVNVKNILLRQTKICLLAQTPLEPLIVTLIANVHDVDVEIATKDLPVLWAELNKLGYLPNGAQDPIHAPGGIFVATASKYKLDRSK